MSVVLNLDNADCSFDGIFHSSLILISCDNEKCLNAKSSYRLDIKSSPNKNNKSTLYSKSPKLFIAEIA